MPPTVPASIQALWQKFAGLHFEEGDLAELLLALDKLLRTGTLAAELARALNEESLSPEADPEPAALRLEGITELPKTERIDGILPLTIPVPSDVRWPADELFAEAERLGLSIPAQDRGRMRDELALAYLALLHDRPLVSSHRLPIRLYASCPGASTDQTEGSLMLLARLPLGGTATIFFSHLPAAEHCDFAPAATEHIDRLALRRRPNGELLLAEGKNRPYTRVDRWTFRL